jgi:acetyl-CoA C-acetyltransferase
MISNAITIGGAGREVVICAIGRTPFGKYQGALAPLTGPELGAHLLDRLIEKCRIDPSRVDAVYSGIGLLGGSMLTATRQMVLRSSLPDITPSMGIDRACCSGMTAIALAARDITAGLCNMIIAGGFESLSNVPVHLPRRVGTRPGSAQIFDPLVLQGDVVDRPLAVYSGEESVALGVTREQQDAWAEQSHRRYYEADAKGWLANERIEVRLSNGKQEIELLTDEGPRRDCSIEKLAKLKPVYGGPSITAGNAPGLSDGAAFVVVTTRAMAQEMGLPILAIVRAYAQVSGTARSGMFTPAHAISQLLRATNTSIRELDRIEINEAYAATPLVSTLKLAGESKELLEKLRSITNPWGGAVAIGHPLGASGARLVMTLANGFLSNQSQPGSLAVAAICGGFGQGDALLLASP